MGTRKNGETQVRNLTQNSSGTYSVSLPLKVVKELGWQQGQKVIVVKKGNGLVVEDWKEK